ncbi:MAG: hypothetical protein JWN15_1537 [Firmicutes bacterium]|nr:hypothetical protein [Bacillota bacterium]
MNRFTRSASIIAPAVYPGLERPAFGSGQVLAPSDLNALAGYTREKLQAVLRFLGGPGVAAGLEVRPTSPSGSKVWLDPGYALDGLGRDLHLREPSLIDLSPLLKGSGTRYFDLAIRAADSVQRTEAPCGPWALQDGKPFPVRMLEGVQVEVIAVQPSSFLSLAAVFANLDLTGFTGVLPGRELHLLANAYHPVAITSAGGRMAIAQGGAQGFGPSPGPTLALADTASGSTLQTIHLKTPLAELRATGDGTRLCGLTTDGFLLVWDAGTMMQLLSLSYAPEAGLLATAPTGRAFAVADLAGQRCVYWHDEKANGRTLLPVSRQAAPTGIALSTDHTLYLSVADTLQRFDVNTGQGAILAQGLPQPHALALSRDGACLFVAFPFSHAVGVIETATGKLAAYLPAGRWPAQLLVHPTRDLLYAVNAESEDVTVVSLTSGKIVATLPTGKQPGWAGFDGAGRLWVPNRQAQSVSIINPGIDSGGGRSANHALVGAGAQQSITLARIRVDDGQTGFAAEHIDNSPYARRELPSLSLLGQYLQDQR